MEQPLSAAVMFLRQYQLPSLMLVAVRSSKETRRNIWRYLTRWSKIKAPLDGRDLKAMGLKPGPQYKQILDELLQATLDGEILPGDRSVAEAFVRERYPNLEFRKK